MSVERNKELARRFAEEHHQANYVAVHDELLAPDCRIHFYQPGVPDPLDREGHKQMMAMFRAALPDIRSTAEDVFGEGDRVAVRWTGSGTHQGEIMGVPPSGARVSATGIFVFHFRDGKIVEYWENWDTLGFLQQIGAIPSPAQTSA